MDSMSVKVPKAKLPRKRKKKAIKAQGRKWYYDTILFYYICLRNPALAERKCKFWDNSSIKPRVRVINETPIVVKEATRFF